MNGLRTTLTVLALTLLIAGCSTGPADIHYGSDECAHCRMMIADPAFASQMVTVTGKAVKFDAIECMGSYRSENPAEAEGASFWVSDFNEPGTWLGLEDAVLIQSENIRSPMGAGLLAVESQQAAERHMAEYPGQRTSWERIAR
ncbi:MAG: nitrous oxide reductase accessory protein NosL [Balneolaceae bacterium]|nr:nitrous oxide reductase accessory protein NosL [Balneolaceae bacterium]